MSLRKQATPVHSVASRDLSVISEGIMSFFINLLGLSSPPKRPSDKPKIDATRPDQSQAGAPESDAAPPVQSQPEDATLSLSATDVPAVAPETPVAKKIRGFVDAFHPPGVLAGWALDDANPAAPLVIQVLLDGREIGSGVTSTRRPDLTWALDNTAGYRIDTKKNIDPEKFFDRKVELLADGHPIAIGSWVIKKLKSESSSPQ